MVPYKDCGAGDMKKSMAELRVRQVPEHVYRELKVMVARGESPTLNELINSILKAYVDKRVGKTPRQ